MTSWILVALGAAVGAPTRYAVTELLRSRGATSRAGTLLVNVVGAFVLGLLAGAAVGGSGAALVGVGFCGALTTMSTLALEVWDCLLDDRRPQALWLVVLHLILGLGASALGVALG